MKKRKIIALVVWIAVLIFCIVCIINSICMAKDCYDHYIYHSSNADADNMQAALLNTLLYIFLTVFHFLTLTGVSILAWFVFNSEVKNKGSSDTDKISRAEQRKKKKIERLQSKINNLKN